MGTWFVNSYNFLFSSYIDDNGNNTFKAVWWLIVVGGLLALSTYYWVEGRYKIPGLKTHMVWRNRVLDPLTKQLAWWGSVGIIIIAAQAATFWTPFSLRLWSIVIVAWGVGIAIVWATRVRTIQHLLVLYEKQQLRARYQPGIRR